MRIGYEVVFCACENLCSGLNSSVAEIHSHMHFECSYLASSFSSKPHELVELFLLPNSRLRICCVSLIFLPKRKKKKKKKKTMRRDSRKQDNKPLS